MKGKKLIQNYIDGWKIGDEMSAAEWEKIKTKKYI